MGRQPHSLCDLEQPFFGTRGLCPQILDDLQIAIHGQVEPGHPRDKNELLTRQVARLPARPQHIVQPLGKVSDFGVILGICAAGIVDVLHTDPDLPEEFLESGDKLAVRRLGLHIGIRLVVVGTMIQVHAEHALVGVAPGSLDVRTHMASDGGDKERRWIPVEQFLGGAQPSLTFCRLPARPTPSFSPCRNS